MEKFATENLILLEFLVDQINLDFEIQQELASVMGETCVSFQFLDNAPLLVCEQDFSSNNKLDTSSNIKSGKSCLFSLTPQQAEDATKTFDIAVEVFKKMKPGVLPDKIPIGASLICIVNLFNELVDSIVSSGESPAAKALKDCFKISNSNGENVGHISVYIRMSCFGKLIVTQFQMNLEDKSVQFKAKEGHYLFKYNKVNGNGKGGPPQDGGDWQKKQQYNTDCPNLPCANFMVDQYGGNRPPVPQPCPLQPCPFNPPQTTSIPCQIAMSTPQINPCGMPQMPCLPPTTAGFNSQYGMPPMMDTPCMECSAPPPTPSPSGAYQEIGAQMGGNALTIRVHKDKQKVEEYADTISSDDGCCCNMESFHKKKKQRPASHEGCLPCATCQKEQRLAMRPGVPDPNVPFSFKMAGCGQGANNNVIVNPPTCTAKDGTVFTEIADPNKEVFILRIGKKSEGVDKKNNLELELCTPKGPEIKPPPKKETRDTQYEEGDVGPEGGKGGKDKGKGKGGKKKGKGKGKGGKGGKGKGGKGGKGDGDHGQNNGNNIANNSANNENYTGGKGSKDNNLNSQNASSGKDKNKGNGHGSGNNGTSGGGQHGGGDKNGNNNGGKGGNNSGGKGGSNTGGKGGSNSGGKGGNNNGGKGGTGGKYKPGSGGGKNGSGDGITGVTGGKYPGHKGSSSAGTVHGQYGGGKGHGYKPIGKARSVVGVCYF